MSMININGIELEIDLLDADAMEKYQAALNKATSKIAELANAKPAGEGLHVAEDMRTQCRLVEDFINEVFGEGTAQKCFPKPNHLGDHLEAFTKVCNQANLAVRQTKDIMGKYSGERLNRQQRREQNRKNRNAIYPAQ